MYKKIYKPFFDYSFALIILIILLPLFIIVSILIKVDSSGSIFFLQDRIGKNGSIFKIYKFRTMTDKPRVAKELYGNDSEITKIGFYLRRLKIDELPQLLNILKGEMSFIGPRPGLPEQLKDYSEIAKIRLKVKPGLTGYSQTNGNIYLSWEQRWEYDKNYVENISGIFDFKILLKTILVVFFGEKKFKKHV